MLYECLLFHVDDGICINDFPRLTMKSVQSKLKLKEVNID